MRSSRWWWLGAAACIVLWITLTFVLTLRTGWTHVPLVAGVLAVVRAIVARDAERAR